jgi:hypothetical protein
MNRVGLILSLAALASCGSHAVGRAPDQHRPNADLCAEPAPPGNVSCQNDCTTSPFFECSGDADCASKGPSGRCVNGGGPAGSTCTFDTCTSDADCASGETCACHGSPYVSHAGSYCVHGNCRVDADCGNGGYCSPSPASDDGNGSFGLGYYCHTPKDFCLNDADCAARGNFACTFSVAARRWECRDYARPI